MNLRHLQIRRFFAGLSTCLLISLLLVLTAANFILYPLDDFSSEALSELPADETTGYWGGNPGSGPDEKTPGNPLSISEEYVHEKDAFHTLLDTPQQHFHGIPHEALLQAAYDALERPPQA